MAFLEHNSNRGYFNSVVYSKDPQTKATGVKYGPAVIHFDIQILAGPTEI